MMRKYFYFSCIILLVFQNTEAQSSADYIKIVKAYADEMIKNGQDRYGEVSSPLFATALRRDTVTLLPYPEFQSRGTESTPGNRWVFESSFLNIPMLGAKRNGSGDNGVHGMEKPHKQILSGDNPIDNLGLYIALYTLSDIVADGKYRNAALQSLRWFYLNTQGPSGLYPWGEHMGWDFRYDYVTYHIKGYEDFMINPYRGKQQEPITEMYQSWQHEPRGMYTEWDPFLQILAELPAKEGEFYKPIEKYALGIWEEHFFDKENGLYNRHGDYFGQKRGIEGTYGGDLMFTKYTGYFISTWSLALQYSDNSEFQKQITVCVEKLINANKRLHEKYGYRPALLNGEGYDTRQCLQMAYQMIKAGQRIEAKYPELGKSAIEYGYAEVEYFCNYIGSDINKYESKDAETLYHAYVTTKDVRLLEIFRQVVDYILEKRQDRIYYNAGQAAKDIECLLNAYKLFGEKRYLDEADKYARLAVELYINADSPLPKCVPADSLTTIDGKIWKTYYYSHLGSDDLMAALIKLASVLKSVNK